MLAHPIGSSSRQRPGFLRLSCVDRSNAPANLWRVFMSVYTHTHTQCRFSKSKPGGESVAALFSSSAEIVRNANSRLHNSTYTELRGIECSFHEGVLSLRGIVHSFFLKQLAQVMVADIRGVAVVSNHLEVRSRGIPGLAARSSF
jgi:hypothetical protein